MARGSRLPCCNSRSQQELKAQQDAQQYGVKQETAPAGAGAPGLGQQQGHRQGQAAWTLPQVIYSSRTHSQLTQVVKELKNTKYRCGLKEKPSGCAGPTTSADRHTSSPPALAPARHS